MYVYKRLRELNKGVNFCVLPCAVNWPGKLESHLEILAPIVLSIGS